METEEKAKNDTVLALSAQERRIRGEVAAKAAKDAKRRDKQVGRLLGAREKAGCRCRYAVGVWGCVRACGCVCVGGGGCLCVFVFVFVVCLCVGGCGWM